MAAEPANWEPEPTAMRGYINERLRAWPVRVVPRRDQDQRHREAVDAMDPKARAAAERVLHHVARYYGISVATLTGPKRPPDLAEPRAVACVLLRELVGLGVTITGHLLNRDHSTVLHHLGHWPAADAAAQEALADIRRAVQAAGAQTPQEQADTIKRAKRLVGMVAASLDFAVPRLLFDPGPSTPWRIAAVLLHCQGMTEDSAAVVLQCRTALLQERWVALGLTGADDARYRRLPLSGEERRLLVACAARARQKGLLGPDAAARACNAGMPPGGMRP